MNVENLDDDAVYNEVGNYYLTNNKLHDVQFIVGENQTLMTAVRLPLINQSRAWWSMLSEDSPLAEKGAIRLPDVEPEVFTLLLKHSYGGLETLGHLSVETVINLCYCANKYFMKQLMEKIATRLQPKDVECLFPAIHCLVLFNLTGVEANVKKIVHKQTSDILEHPEFVDCDVDIVSYICQQDSLECSELSLWKAVVEWAKHNAKSSEGVELRKWMKKPLKLLRLLTLSAIDLRDYVFPLEILDYMEMINVCKNDLSSVPTLCNNKSLRVCAAEKKGEVVTVKITQNATNRNEHYHESKETCCCITTKDQNLELESVVIRGRMCPTIFNERKEILFNGSRFSMSQFTVKVTRITNLLDNTSDEAPILRRLRSVYCNNFDKTEIPLFEDKGNKITLLANSKYKVEFTFSMDLPCWNSPNCAQGHEFEHGTFFCSFSYNNGVGLTPCHILAFSYRVVDG